MDESPKNNIPTPGECHALMANTPSLSAGVVRHCRAVAEIATALAEAVNRAGGNLDVALVTSAALIHDIVNRTETAMTQDHSFLAMELALKAENMADRLGYLKQ